MLKDRVGAGVGRGLGDAYHPGTRRPSRGDDSEVGPLRQRQRSELHGSVDGAEVARLVDERAPGESRVADRELHRDNARRAAPEDDHVPKPLAARVRRRRRRAARTRHRAMRRGRYGASPAVLPHDRPTSETLGDGRQPSASSAPPGIRGPPPAPADLDVERRPVDPMETRGAGAPETASGLVNPSVGHEPSLDGWPAQERGLGHGRPTGATGRRSGAMIPTVAIRATERGKAPPTKRCPSSRHSTRSGRWRSASPPSLAAPGRKRRPERQRSRRQG